MNIGIKSYEISIINVHNYSKIIINWYLLPLYVMFSTTVYHLQRNKTGTEFLTL